MSPDNYIRGMQEPQQTGVKKVLLKLADSIRNWIVKPMGYANYTVHQRTDFYSSAHQAEVWYRGDALELAEFYAGYPADNQSFWKAAMTKGMEIRKIHTDAAAVLADTVSDIVTNAYMKMVFEDEEDQKIWDAISADSSFKKLLRKAISDTLICGDGVWKISFDPQVSEHVMIEFIPGDRTNYVETAGHCTETDIVIPFYQGNKECRYTERYRKGGIERFVTDENGNENDVSSYFPETDAFTECPHDVSLAVKQMFYASPKYDGRGKPIYEGKYGDLDALDECVSQWMDAVRSGRVRTFIPRVYLPYDENGNAMEPNAFDNRFIQTNEDMSENASNKITSEQAQIQDAAYMSTYLAIMDRILQGVISQATFGLDNKKTDNADAQKEKEKVTLQTRALIIGTLEEILPALARAAVAEERYVTGQGNKAAADILCHADFAEYVTPSFEAIMETCGKAVTYGIMSTRRAVTKLYGYGATDKEIEDELAEIKKENEDVQRIKKVNVNTDADTQEHSNTKL